MVLLAEFPCLLRAYLHPGLAGYHDHRRVRRADCFLYLPDKIEVSRGVQYIDLGLFPLDRHDACADGKSSLLLFLIKITGRIGLGNLAHTLCSSGYI